MKTYEEFAKLLGNDAVIPMNRITGKLIEACAEENPCEVCSRAEYNKLCTDVENCAALKYHTLAKMSTMVRDFFK